MDNVILKESGLKKVRPGVMSIQLFMWNYRVQNKGGQSPTSLLSVAWTK